MKSLVSKTGNLEPPVIAMNAFDAYSASNLERWPILAVLT